MRNPGRGQRRQFSAWVRQSPVVLALALAWGWGSVAKPAVAKGVLDRWKLFSPVSSQAVDTKPHPAVVRVIVEEGNALSNGSGSFVAARDQYGLVVTNWHVVRDAKGAIQVVFPDGFRSEATVLKTDQEWDLAALLIWRPQVNPISICMTAPQPGDPLTIAGYGQGDYRAVTGKCTQYLAPSIKHPYEIVEMSVAARKGDSGGPILNDRGELAGVLFGADHGTTSGSYCGRVHWFLSSVWPELEITQHAKQPSTPLVGFPSAPPPSEASATTQNLIPINPPAAPADPTADAGNSVESDTDAADERDTAIPYTSLPLLPDYSSSSGPKWSELIGTTKWDQAKAFLAVIGMLAIWGHLSRWMSR